VPNNGVVASISPRPPGSFHDAGLSFGGGATPVVDLSVSDVGVGLTPVVESITAVAVVIGIVNSVSGLLYARKKPNKLPGAPQDAGGVVDIEDVIDGGSCWWPGC
jgi:hypothetical protein